MIYLLRGITNGFPIFTQVTIAFPNIWNEVHTFPTIRTHQMLKYFMKVFPTDSAFC